MNELSVGQILKKALERLKEQNPKVSMRALAQKAGVSAAFFSHILNDKAPLPVDRIESIAKVLKLDLYTVDEIKRRLAKDKLGEFIDHLPADKTISPQASFVNSHNYAEKNFPLLESWENLAILNLVSCSDFVPDNLWIARRLSIPEEKVLSSVQLLFESGLLKEENGKWLKVNETEHFPTTSSHPSMRSFQKEMLKKAIQQMNENTDKEAFKNRHNTWGIFAANPDKIPDAKIILRKALHEAAEKLNEGDCTEVFYLSHLLFPVTNDSSLK